mmetsp:Transcript_45571/g.74238  ORF Transcript_45571/g.74238 Transcript_45571/m.74238 type:complete len:412 (+) Transcript_45571:92-1327(+)
MSTSYTFITIIAVLCIFSHVSAQPISCNLKNDEKPITGRLRVQSRGSEFYATIFLNDLAVKTDVSLRRMNYRDIGIEDGFVTIEVTFNERTLEAECDESSPTDAWDILSRFFIAGPFLIGGYMTYNYVSTSSSGTVVQQSPSNQISDQALIIIVVIAAVVAASLVAVFIIWLIVRKRKKKVVTGSLYVGVRMLGAEEGMKVSPELLPVLVVLDMNDEPECVVNGVDEWHFEGLPLGNRRIEARIHNQIIAKAEAEVKEKTMVAVWLPLGKVPVGAVLLSSVLTKPVQVMAELIAYSLETQDVIFQEQQTTGPDGRVLFFVPTTAVLTPKAYSLRVIGGPRNLICHDLLEWQYTPILWQEDENSPWPGGSSFPTALDGTCPSFAVEDIVSASAVTVKQTKRYGLETTKVLPI